MIVPRFIKIFRPTIHQLLRISNIRSDHLFSQVVFIHHLFYSPFHHPEILLGVDVFSFRLVLDILNFSDITVVILVAVNTVVDAGKWSWGLVKQVLELQNRVIINGLILGHDRNILRIIIKILPTIRVKP